MGLNLSEDEKMTLLHYGPTMFGVQVFSTEYHDSSDEEHPIKWASFLTCPFCGEDCEYNEYEDLSKEEKNSLYVKAPSGFEQTGVSNLRVLNAVFERKTSHKENCKLKHLLSFFRKFEESCK